MRRHAPVLELAPHGCGREIDATLALGQLRHGLASPQIEGRQPKLSLIIPCFDPLDYFEAAIQSAAVAEPDEVVVVDDGSSMPEVIL
ncbi:MAG TPA: glycosyltransferase, partial [Edaphobacter sp.]